MSWFSLIKQKNKNKKSDQVYLDYAAATPLNVEVRKVIEQAFSLYANPSAIHNEGVMARRAIDDARLRLARNLKIRPEGVVFTGSGTESNNLAIYGLVRHLNESGREYRDMTIISTKLEHPSVEEVLKDLVRLGVKVEYCDVKEDGLVDLNHFRSLLSSQVVLVTMAYVNSEIGVVQPISKVSRLVKKYNQEEGSDIKVHADAAQAPLWLACQFDLLGVDMMSLDAGKCYGPKGVGVLALRHGVELKSVLLGGGQEMGLRSSTENTPLILGAVEALVRAQEGREKRSEQVSELRNKGIDELLGIDGVKLNGSKGQRVANNINISVASVDGEFAVVSLDEAGFAISTKSACSGTGGGGSRVVETIYGDSERAKSTLRITLGEETKLSELNRFAKKLKQHIVKVRSANERLTQG